MRLSRFAFSACCAVLASHPSLCAEQAWPVLSRLDLARPELAATKAALAAQGEEGAAAALLRHFRTRQNPRWFKDAPPAPKANPGATDPHAEKIIRREYSFVGKPATLTRDLDWNANPLKDPEWPIELNRHYTWVRLVDAYNRTGNPAYAEDFAAQLRDWCGDNPRPESPRQARFTWRTLECGIRLSGSWPSCFHGMLHSPVVTPELLCLMLEAVWQQADYLARHPTGGNWLVTETSGLMTAAVLFPEFADAPRWQKTAFERLAREIDNQALPDGAQIELTPHYHGVTMGSFGSATRIAEHNGIPVPANVEAGVLRMARYLMDVSKPNLHIPMFNDSDDGSVEGRIKAFADRVPGARHVLARGKEGAPPPYTSVALPHCGQYVMRSGWDEQALYLAMDAGPYGAGHQHEDKLHFDVHAHGRSHILDPGRFTYAGGPWRSYFLATRSHSTMLVDGQGQNRRRTPRNRWIARRPQDNLWIAGEIFDFAAGSYDEGYGKGAADPVHIRKIFFKRGEYWLVHDLLVGPPGTIGEHTASIQFQFGAPGAVATADGAAIVSANDDANLAILPVSDQPCEVRLHEGEENPPRGWIAWSLHKALKTPATLAVVERKAALPIRIDTLLLPYAGKERPPIAIRRLPEDSPERSALEIVGPDWRDVYRCAHAPGTGPTIEWIRHARDGRELARASHGETTAGDELAVEPQRQRIVATVPSAGRLFLDYGYAEGGGYLFRREQEAKEAGECVLPLPSFHSARPYVYSVRFVPAEGAARSASGTFVPRTPPVHDFQTGDPGDWSNASIAAEKENRFLRAERKPETNAVYLGIDHPLPGLKADQATFSCRYRLPFADGGDWCYCKLALTDAEGRRWSAYLADKPTPAWRTANLQRRDFRRDDGNKGSGGMPADAVLRKLSLTVRKGRTKAPVAAVLELDDVSWTDGR